MHKSTHANFHWMCEMETLFWITLRYGYGDDSLLSVMRKDYRATLVRSLCYICTHANTDNLSMSSLSSDWKLIKRDSSIILEHIELIQFSIYFTYWSERSFNFEFQKNRWITLCTMVIDDCTVHTLINSLNALQNVHIRSFVLQLSSHAHRNISSLHSECVSLAWACI